MIHDVIGYLAFSLGYAVGLTKGILSSPGGVGLVAAALTVVLVLRRTNLNRSRSRKTTPRQ
jgi:hypothetical protein